jgi:hypothetical protein
VKSGRSNESGCCSPVCAGVHWVEGARAPLLAPSTRAHSLRHTLVRGFTNPAFVGIGIHADTTDEER